MQTYVTPNHYTRWKIQPIEFIRANNLDFARANIIKYIMRYDDKEGMKDLEKAKQYLVWLIEDFENDSKSKANKKAESYYQALKDLSNKMTPEETNLLKDAETTLFEKAKALKNEYPDMLPSKDVWFKSKDW